MPDDFPLGLLKRPVWSEAEIRQAMHAVGVDSVHADSVIATLMLILAHRQELTMHYCDPRTHVQRPPLKRRLPGPKLEREDA
jgi:hypothetical protein